MGISARITPNRPSLDLVGATASIVCAVHCVVVALLLGAMPMVSLLASSWIDWVFFAASAGIGCAALVPGFRRHRQVAPLLLFATGMLMLLVIRALAIPPSVGELVVVLLAAACIVSAHFRNRGALHACACGPKHH